MRFSVLRDYIIPETYFIRTEHPFLNENITTIKKMKFIKQLSV